MIHRHPGLRLLLDGLLRNKWPLVFVLVVAIEAAALGGLAGRTTALDEVALCEGTLVRETSRLIRVACKDGRVLTLSSAQGIRLHEIPAPGDERTPRITPAGHSTP